MKVDKGERKRNRSVLRDWNLLETYITRRNQQLIYLPSSEIAIRKRRMPITMTTARLRTLQWPALDRCKCWPKHTSLILWSRAWKGSINPKWWKFYTGVQSNWLRQRRATYLGRISTYAPYPEVPGYRITRERSIALSPFFRGSSSQHERATGSHFCPTLRSCKCSKM